MRTALLHYWLTNRRGGEKVLAALGKMFPDADIFTHSYLPSRFDEATPMQLWGHRVRQSVISRLPLGRRYPQAYLPLLPAASRSLKLDGYDLIVSSESGPIKGISKPAGARHVCYCHTPMRYLWDMRDDYYHAAGIGGKLAMRMFGDYLRKEDLKSVESVDHFVANSAFVAERIKRIYGRDSTVVHPPVDVEYYGDGHFERKGYYLLAGQQVAYKHPELAVQACMKMDRPLVVVGEGGMQRQLVRLAAKSPRVHFLGRVADEILRRCYAEARALLFPGIEDFGIVPVEAQAAGTPVIAFGKGGVCETVRDGVTGLLFAEQTVEALCNAMETFEAKTWEMAACRTNAARFSALTFRAKMWSIVKELGFDEHETAV